jgi:aminoglycoside 3-N-acetyltransferase
MPDRVKTIVLGMRHHLRHGLKDARRRLSAPRIDKAQILEAFSRLPVSMPRLLFVHSSLSACGHMKDGAETVIEALRSWNAGGTLTMPAHSYCYPIGTAPPPVFDPAVTRSVVGAVTDAFWRLPGVKRSLHPTHSIAAEGPAADDIVRGHETCDTPCGPRTPYERLVQADAAVLMFGARLDAYTLFHTAEDDARVAYLYEPRQVPLTYRDARGVEHPMMMWRHDVAVARSFHEKDTWLERHGLLHRVALGTGELMVVPHAKRAHDAIVAELRREPSFLRAA